MHLGLKKTHGLLGSAGVYGQHAASFILQTCDSLVTIGTRLTILLLKGQLSCREMMNGEKLTADLPKDASLLIGGVDGPYSSSDHLRQHILERGLE